MTSHPLDLDAAICRFVLNVLSGEEAVAVAEHALEEGRWCDEFCVLVGWKEPLLREVEPYFARGVRSLGLSLPAPPDAMIGIGVWRSKQILEGVIRPGEATWSLRKIAQENWEHLDPILMFYGLDCELESLEYREGWREAEREIELSIIEEARRFLAEHSHSFPVP